MAEKRLYSQDKVSHRLSYKVRPVANVVKEKLFRSYGNFRKYATKGATLIKSTMKSAIANALYANKKLDEEMLYVKDVQIDEVLD